jgi:Asp-tRNA(Asn)/Glu-tRNA(Gln) amidotransferase A subunit family amidase
LPVGLQLIAGRFKDRRLFDIAEAVTKALGQDMGTEPGFRAVAS